VQIGVAEAAACETETPLPATVPDPVRELVELLAATVNPTDPDPLRPVPFWNVRKLLALVAPHVHPVCVVTLIVPVVPAAATLRLEGLIE
jgi:hypothetical protein